MKREHEDKRLGGVETKDDAIDALNCPERDQHAQRLGQKCGGCGEVVPGGGYYSPEQYRRYFGAPMVESPPHPFAPGPENARLWAEYDVLRQEREDALVAVARAKEGRHAVRRTSRGVGPDGNEVSDATAPLRGARADMSAEEASEHFRRADEAARDKLQEIQKEERTRGGKAFAAAIREATAPPEPGLLERAAAAIGGDR